MSIKNLFRQQSNTIADLQKKYRDIEGQKKSLEEKADRLRAESLRSDTSDTQKKIDEIREELLLADVALEQIKKEVERALEKKIESDYRSLDSEKRKYETEISDLSEKSGRSLGQTVKTLQTLNLSFARNLGTQIRQLVKDFSSDHRFAKQMERFLKFYGDTINIQSDTKDFRAWKARLKKAEELKPGSQAAKNHVKGEILDLLKN